MMVYSNAYAVGRGPRGLESTYSAIKEKILMDLMHPRCQPRMSSPDLSLYTTSHLSCSSCLLINVSFIHIYIYI